MKERNFYIFVSRPKRCNLFVFYILLVLDFVLEKNKDPGKQTKPEVVFWGEKRVENIRSGAKFKIYLISNRP